MRRAITLFLAASVVAVSAASGSAVAQDPPSATSDDAYDRALARAASTGRPVEVTAVRSETDTVFANPSGTLSREMSSVPVRVKRDGDWKDVDLTLHEVDGVLTPRVAPDEIALSAGGDAPLMELDFEGVTTTLSWPGELPEPAVDGETATYADVLPGVDLRLTVTDAGVSQVLVVHDEKAARSTALRELELESDVQNGSLEERDGGFVVLDEFGRTVGEAAQPVMWDSSGKVLDADGAAVADSSKTAVDERTEGPALGDDVTPVELAVDDDSLTLEPPAGALTGDEVQYPIFIDPKASSNASRWAMAFKQHPNTTFYNWTDSAGQGVGYQNYDGESKKRLFFQHSISAVVNRPIIRATFKTRMNWSASCTTRGIRMWSLKSAVKNDLTWNNQPDWDQLQDTVAESAGHSGCNPNGIDVDWNITQAVAEAAASGRAWVSLGLKAASEDDPLSWRRLRHSSSITVEYNVPPNTPTSIGISDIPCSASSVVRLGRMTERPEMQARVSDPDEENVRARFQWTNASSVNAGSPEIGTALIKSGSLHTTEYPVAPGSDRTIPTGTYSFRVRAQDAKGLLSGYSPECTFQTDSTAPPPPVLENPPNPATGWNRGVAQKITVRPGTGDTVKYRWAVDSDQPSSGDVMGDSSNGYRGTFTVPAQTTGLKYLKVWAYDLAGNRSESYARYDFEVQEPKDSYVRSTYAFDEANGDAADSTGDLAAVALGDVRRALRAMFMDEQDEWRKDLMLDFRPEGITAFPQSSGPYLRAKRSFSVGAFLDPAAAADGGPMTAVSLRDPSGFELELGVEPFDGGGFIYVFRTRASASNPWKEARVGGDDGSVGTRLVVGRYDALSGTMTVTHTDTKYDEDLVTSPVTVVGPAFTALQSQSMRLGSRPDGTSQWRGAIDHVVIQHGVMIDQDLRNLEGVRETPNGGECTSVDAPAGCFE